MSVIYAYTDQRNDKREWYLPWRMEREGVEREIYRERRIGIEGKGKDRCDADSKTEFCREQSNRGWSGK